MSINAVATKVEIAFGFGPGSSPGPSDWVDVSADLYVTPTSSGVTASSGRGAVRSGITPGRMSFTLENNSGKFNPRNPSGPYFGLLDNGVQVRVTTTYGATTTSSWTGFVDSGWPQEITSRSPVVNITATDTFGVIAQGDAPRSAWDATVRNLAVQPDQWWTAGADGWIDNIQGRSARHTGGRLEMDSLVDGEPKTWGQLDSDGRGVIEDIVLDPGSSDRMVIGLWFKAGPFEDPANRLAIPLFTQSSDIERRSSVMLRSSPFGLEMAIEGPTWGTGGTTMRTSAIDGTGAQLWDGRPRFVMVIIERPTMSGWVHTPELADYLSTSPYPSVTGPRPRFFVDGIEPPALGFVSLIGSPPSVSSGSQLAASPALIGGVTDWWRTLSDLNYSGTLDHVMVWKNHPADPEDIKAISKELADAGRLAWAGQSMDQRVSKIMEGMGLSEHVGTLDTSGITTQQGYRSGSPLELLQNVENTEQGRIRTDRFGEVRFSKRTWAWDDARSTSVQVTFSDDPTLIAGGAQTMLEAGTSITDDPLNIVNVASVNSTYGRQQTAENAPSVAKYGRRNTVQLSNLLHPSDRQSRSLAEWLVLSQGTPRIQANQVSFRVEDNPSVLAPLAQQIEEGWLVRIRKLTTADTLDLYAHVIGVAHSWTYTGWTVTLTLDSTRTGFGLFSWGTSTWGGSSGWAF